MGEMGPERLLFLVVVALLLFGAKRLPEVGASLGRGFREFRRGLAGGGDAGLAGADDEPAAPHLVHSASPPPAAGSGKPKRLSDRETSGG
jgi:TatA/E family protein of Tat protein translocase